MTKHSWLERLTPFTGGMAMAVLVMALVVQPAWGQTGTHNTCTQCLNYWEYKLTRDKTCGTWTTQVEYYAWRDCMEEKKAEKCVGQPDSGMPCPGKEVPNTLADCGGSGCNMYDGIPGVSVCNWDCWNRYCTDAGTQTCLAVQRGSR